MSNSKRIGLTLLLMLGMRLCGHAADRAVLLEWEYPTNNLAADLTFKIYSSTDVAVPQTNWVVLTNVVGTNLSVVLPVVAEKRFFYMTASNFWGESVPSNTMGVPAPAQMPDKTSIKRVK